MHFMRTFMIAKAEYVPGKNSANQDHQLMIHVKQKQCSSSAFFFTADVLACHRSKSTGVNDNIA